MEISRDVYFPVAVGRDQQSPDGYLGFQPVAPLQFAVYLRGGGLELDPPDEELRQCRARAGDVLAEHVAELAEVLREDPIEPPDVELRRFRDRPVTVELSRQLSPVALAVAEPLDDRRRRAGGLECAKQVRDFTLDPGQVVLDLFDPLVGTPDALREQLRCPFQHRASGAAVEHLALDGGDEGPVDCLGRFQEIVRAHRGAAFSVVPAAVALHALLRSRDDDRGRTHRARPDPRE